MTMKKATIKRRKRVIPATQDEEMDESADSPEAMSGGGTPERGTENEDGSINLGFRRRPEQHPLMIEPRPAELRTSGHSSPRPSTSDLAAYHQHGSVSRADANRLPPMSSMAAISDRQSSVSPASFMSPRRKRSFSATDTDAGSAMDGGHESAKRISSIKSILNPSTGRDGPSMGRPGASDLDDYRLPPLRSSGGLLGPHAADASPGPALANNSPGHSRRDSGESDRIKSERRLALQREAERMREMLAAKERELMELGNE